MIDLIEFAILEIVTVIFATFVVCVLAVSILLFEKAADRLFQFIVLGLVYSVLCFAMSCSVLFVVTPAHPVSVFTMIMDNFR